MLYYYYYYLVMALKRKSALAIPILKQQREKGVRVCFGVGGGWTVRG